MEPDDTHEDGIDRRQFEPYAERRLREWLEAGPPITEIPGAGRPIPGLDRPYDPAWWARRWIERERLRTKARDLARRVTRELATVIAAGDVGRAAEVAGRLAAEVDAMNTELDPGDRIPAVDVAGVIARVTARRPRPR